MNNKKKRFRQAAACFLAAALTIFSGPGVFSPAAEESETVQELSETDTELTAGAAEESLTETSYGAGNRRTDPGRGAAGDGDTGKGDGNFC